MSDHVVKPFDFQVDCIPALVCNGCMSLLCSFVCSLSPIRRMILSRRRRSLRIRERRRMHCSKESLLTHRVASPPASPTSQPCRELASPCLTLHLVALLSLPPCREPPHSLHLRWVCRPQAMCILQEKHLKSKPTKRPQAK